MEKRAVDLLIEFAKEWVKNAPEINAPYLQRASGIPWITAIAILQELESEGIIIRAEGQQVNRWKLPGG